MLGMMKRKFRVTCNGLRHAILILLCSVMATAVIILLSPVHELLAWSRMTLEVEGPSDFVFVPKPEDMPNKYLTSGNGSGVKGTLRHEIEADLDPSTSPKHTGVKVTLRPKSKPALDLLTPHILHMPAWVQNKGWGLTTFNKTRLPRGRSLDVEVGIAWRHFFRGMTNGLMLELGAMDGVARSASKPFEAGAGWKTILIEGDRATARKIPIARPESLSLQLVVCDKPQSIHFLSAGSVGGVLEFMDTAFLKRYHAHFLKRMYRREKGLETGALEPKYVIDWSKVKGNRSVVEEQCLPLQAVFDRFEISHVNFLVLDLEGGELQALKSLDFDRIHFDILCIETNRQDDYTDPYIAQVIDYVTAKGYDLFRARTIGRNTWFTSLNWTRIFD